jgi:ATP-dependent Clp protease protease subunit
MSQDKEKKNESLPATWDKNLFDSRTVLVFGEVSMEMAQKISAQLIALSTHSKDPIKVVINSPGGHVEAGDTIHDMLQFIDCPVYTIATGWVASMGAMIHLGVPKKYRLCLPNTRFMVHQPSGGMQGTAMDIKIQAEEIIKMKERLNQIISRETGQNIEKVRKDTERDFWLGPDEAIEYGLVDRIVKNIKEVG